MKKLLSLLLVLSLGVSLLGGAALAAGAENAEDAPFRLEATLNEDKTVTLSLVATNQVTLGCIEATLAWPQGFSLTEIAQGSDLTVTPVTNAEVGFASVVDFGGFTLNTGEEFLTYTLDASNAAAGPYTFSVAFDAIATVDVDVLTWNSVTSNSITIEAADEEPVVVTISTETNYASTIPYNANYAYALNEIIYDRSTIAVNGEITALAFHVKANDASLATDSVKIYMGHTDKLTFSAGWADPSTLTLVYEGSPTLGENTDAEGWETLRLDTPFEYDNNYNLVIAVSRASSGTVDVSSLTYYSAYSGYTTALTRYGSSQGAEDVTDTATAGTTVMYRPHLRLTFAPDACTHANTTTDRRDNGDGTHTVTVTCDECHVTLSTTTEGHTFDWVNAELEGDEYVAGCTVCTASTSVSVAGKNPLAVTRAEALEPGKVYVVTDLDGAYAMAVTSAPTRNGGVIRVRHAVPVRVVNDQYVIFEDEAEMSTCQWGYVEGNRLMAYSESYGCDVYLHDNAAGSEESLWITPEVEANGTVMPDAWTYSGGYLRGAVGKIFFDPRPIDNGGLLLYGTSPYFGSGLGFDPVNLYEVVGAHAHVWDDGTVTTPPTCTETGIKTYHCTTEGCEETKTETVPATGHTWENGVCSVCGEPYDSEHAPARDTDGTYLISNAEELVWLAGYVNNGGSVEKAKLTADIQVDASWTWIGSTSTNAFGGEFDGGGHTVTFNETANGLFRYVTGANIHDVTTAGSIEATLYIGAVAVYATETAFTNCVNYASITSSKNRVGGIVCYVKEETTTGQNLTTLTSCVNHGDIQGGAYYVGGIVGYAAGGITVSQCFNTGSVTSDGTVTYTGGVLARTMSVYTTVTESANTGAVTSKGSYVGGFIGAVAGGNIRNCYNTGNVSTTTSSSYVGGFLGYGTYGALYNCYNAGTVSYSSSSLYATQKGPFAPNSFQSTVSNCYYLDGCAAENTGRGTAKTADELKALVATLGTAYTDDIYGINQGYPILTWQLVEPSEPDNDLGVTVEVHKDYVGGCSLVLVYGEADGYLYGENAMYRTPSYDDEEKGTAFAYIVEGEVTEEGVLDVLTEAENAAVEVAASYDVNGTGTVDISDVQAVADCYNYNPETDSVLLAAYMAVYLRADVTKNYQVNEADANLVLVNRE